MNTMNTMNTANTAEEMKKKRAGKTAIQRRDARIAFLILEVQHKAEQCERRGFEKWEEQWTINEYVRGFGLHDNPCMLLLLPWRSIKSRTRLRGVPKMRSLFGDSLLRSHIQQERVRIEK